MKKTLLQPNKRILIVCEDSKSSLKYFESFKKDEKFKRELTSVDIEVIHPKNHDPLGLVNKAKELKNKEKKLGNPYDEIWIVLDRDGHQNLPQAFDKCIANKMEFCISVVCFELWILLHFERTSKPFGNCSEIIKYIKESHNFDYDKTNVKFDELKDKIDFAIENAKWLKLHHDKTSNKKIHELNPYTEIYKLVGKLIPSKLDNTKDSL